MKNKDLCQNLASMEQTNKVLIKKLNIWKDPRVELPKIGKGIYCYGYCELNKEYYSHRGYRFNESTISFENDLDYDINYFNELVKWCYEEDLIEQAEEK